MSEPSTPDHSSRSVPPYPHPAGGWGSLAASVRHLARQQAPLRTAGTMLRVNQPDGFDCPGCAWPDPAHAGAFEFCENGIKAVAWEATGKRVDPAFFERYPVAELRGQSHHWLEAQGRLTHPMRYNPARDRYEPIDWPAAFGLIARHLARLSDPNQAIFYTSGRTSNEAAFLYQLFARLYGTNNLPDCSNMCHESSGFALGESIGVGKGTVTLEDFDHAQAIFVIGQNPGTNHPRMLTVLQQAAQRGVPIVAINPLRERGLERFAHPQRPGQMLTGRSTPISTLYLQPLVGGDLAVLKGIMKHVLEAEAAGGGTLDHAFIAQHTSGFETLKADLEAASWERIEREAGLRRAALKQAADVYLGSQATIICWAMGLTQNRDAVATIQQVVNLLLLRGNLGKPGAGACPVRGHSNVQGDRTMGIVERPDPRFLRRLGEVFAFDPPTEHGHDTVAAIKAMADGNAKVFIGLGGNFAAATPDCAYTEAALARCELTVQVSTKLNRSHLVHGREALILPCLGRSERDVQAGGPQKVTVEDSMSMVHASAGRNPPASPNLYSEVAIIAGLAKATLARLGRNTVDWDALAGDYRLIREKISQVMPELFHDYERRLEQPGGFYLGNPARERVWKTTTGKARFMVHELPELALPEGQLRLMTVRSHDQYNTTIYDHHDRYRGIHGSREVLLMHPDDLTQRGLKEGDRVIITAHWNDGRERRLAGFQAVAYDIPRGCGATYFPEANALVSVDRYAKKSRTPMSKFIPVTVEKA